MIFGIYEYCGIQRCGKSTMLVSDALRIKHENDVLKYMGQEIHIRVISNFHTDIPGVEEYDNPGIIREILRIKKEKVRNVLILFDELSQVLTGRGFMKDEQTEVASFLWQMPKRWIVLLYTSNIGKSVDKIIRDATWQTIMPQYYEGPYPDRHGSTIELDVIDNYQCDWDDEIVVTNVEKVQELFNTWQEIE